ncbi:hypothetical protein J6590_098287 [Homalodisca vitripennis]|nr:hypothetical protein J6590_098287 [Homalodisca vitripennis]
MPPEMLYSANTNRKGTEEISSRFPFQETNLPSGEVPQPTPAVPALYIYKAVLHSDMPPEMLYSANTNRKGTEEIASRFPFQETNLPSGEVPQPTPAVPALYIYKAVLHSDMPPEMLYSANTNRKGTEEIASRFPFQETNLPSGEVPQPTPAVPALYIYKAVLHSDMPPKMLYSANTNRKGTEEISSRFPF